MYKTIPEIRVSTTVENLSENELLSDVGTDCEMLESKVGPPVLQTVNKFDEALLTDLEGSESSSDDDEPNSDDKYPNYPIESLNRVFDIGMNSEEITNVKGPSKLSKIISFDSRNKLKQAYQKDIDNITDVENFEDSDIDVSSKEYYCDLANDYLQTSNFISIIDNVIVERTTPLHTPEPQTLPTSSFQVLDKTLPILPNSNDNPTDTEMIFTDHENYCPPVYKKLGTTSKSIRYISDSCSSDSDEGVNSKEKFKNIFKKCTIARGFEMKSPTPTKRANSLQTRKQDVNATDTEMIEIDNVRTKMFKKGQGKRQNILQKSPIMFDKATNQKLKMSKFSDKKFQNNSLPSQNFNKHCLMSSSPELGRLTDIEAFDSDEELPTDEIRPVSFIPESKSDLVLCSENYKGGVSLIMPIRESSSLKNLGINSRFDNSGHTDTEDLPDFEEINQKVYPLPDLPLENTIIKNVENMIDKSRLKIKLDTQDPHTDTEEIDVQPKLDSSNKLRIRIRNSPQLDIRECLTDVEDLSDTEVTSHPQPETNETIERSGTDIDLLTDYDTDDDDDYNGYCAAITPEIKSINTFTTAKEGIGPFPEETRKKFNETIPKIRRLSPSPVPYNTDSEELPGSLDGEISDNYMYSTDEENFDAHMSTVHIQNTRKFPIEGIESLHIKDCDNRPDPLTDVEEIAAASFDDRYPTKNNPFKFKTPEECSVSFNRSTEGMSCKWHSERHVNSASKEERDTRGEKISQRKPLVDVTKTQSPVTSPASFTQEFIQGERQIMTENQHEKSVKKETEISQVKKPIVTEMTKKQELATTIIDTAKTEKSTIKEAISPENITFAPKIKEKTDGVDSELIKKQENKDFIETIAKQEITTPKTVTKKVETVEKIAIKQPSVDSKIINRQELKDSVEKKDMNVVSIPELFKQEIKETLVTKQPKEVIAPEVVKVDIKETKIIDRKKAGDVEPIKQELEVSKVNDTDKAVDIIDQVAKEILVSTKTDVNKVVVPEIAKQIIKETSKTEIKEAPKLITQEIHETAISKKDDFKEAPKTVKQEVKETIKSIKEIISPEAILNKDDVEKVLAPDTIKQMIQETIITKKDDVEKTMIPEIIKQKDKETNLIKKETPEPKIISQDITETIVSKISPISENITQEIEKSAISEKEDIKKPTVGEIIKQEIKETIVTTNAETKDPKKTAIFKSKEIYDIKKPIISDSKAKEGVRETIITETKSFIEKSFDLEKKKQPEKEVDDGDVDENAFEELIITEVKEDNYKPYVTTPTQSRRVSGIGGSQRLSREERPTVRIVTDFVEDSDSESESEHYIVTEPVEKPTYPTRKGVKFRFDSEDYREDKASDEDVKEIIEEIEDDEPIIMETFTTTITTTTTTVEPKLTKVERRFERMASSDTTAVDDSRESEGEFQKIISQLSTEEVDQALEEWEIGGLTPSEGDSKDTTTTEGSSDHISPIMQGYGDIFKANLSRILPTILYVEGSSYFPLREKTVSGTNDTITTNQSSDNNLNIERNEGNIKLVVVEGETIKTEPQTKETQDGRRREGEEEMQEMASGYSEPKKGSGKVTSPKQKK